MDVQEQKVKVVKAMQWWGRLKSVAKYRANKYKCVRGIWKYVAVPSIMFGMIVVVWNGGDLKKSEVLQNRAVVKTVFHTMMNQQTSSVYLKRIYFLLQGYMKNDGTWRRHDGRSNGSCDFSQEQTQASQRAPQLRG
ncbi:hypothetical protein FHG87_000927 [Trinorchestia longiramus]|nr:hypothetical protein FHG87_000927 [Trinorchestia longiramus]